MLDQGSQGVSGHLFGMPLARQPGGKRRPAEKERQTGRQRPHARQKPQPAAGTEEKATSRHAQAVRHDFRPPGNEPPGRYVKRAERDIKEYAKNAAVETKPAPGVQHACLSGRRRRALPTPRHIAHKVWGKSRTFLRWSRMFLHRISPCRTRSLAVQAGL